MPYFPVDDRFHSHPKSAAASLAALGLWAVAGSWANDHLTDGDVPEHMIPLLSRGATELADELVNVGLWRRTKAGYRFHEWHADGDGSHRNIARSEVIAMRTKKSSGGQIGNHRRWHDGRGVIDPDCLFCQGKHAQSTDRTSDRTSDGGSESGANPPTPPHPTRKKTVLSKQPTDDDPDWTAFWDAYPKKASKGRARKAWPQAIAKAEPATIIAAAVRYAEQRRGEDQKYTMHPATWLNAESWGDQVDVSANGVPAGTATLVSFWDA